jgi:hypothetical protein
MLYRLHRLSREQYKERVRALRKLQLAAAEAMYSQPGGRRMEGRK